MSVFEISLVVSRVVAIAFDLYLLVIGLRALRATRASFRFNAGVTLW